MSWDRFKEYSFHDASLGFSLDVSRIPLDDGYLRTIEPKLARAFQSMEALEKGAIANPDEDRRVGHYWLRAPDLAPEESIARDIRQARQSIESFAQQVHAGAISAPAGPFRQLLIIGIGGSALGPQFVSHALGHPQRDRMKLFFFDNTDPDGMDLVLSELGAGLASTLVVVISKSGGTAETRNGMVEAQAAFAAAGLDFARQAVAVTGEGSRLDKTALSEGWLARFPMWDWVGGRTSVLGPVGLLPAALQGISIDALLAGAAAMDRLTRRPVLRENPAAWLALAWHCASGGAGKKDMVVLPYKDRLLLFSRYLQQLVMESLGKERDLDGDLVRQGLSVYGNKGSTDQHAYVQQLRDGLPNFFVTFIEVLRDRDSKSPEVEPGITSGDYLQGFLLGTRQALSENQRHSLTVTLPDVSPFSVGMLIALYERAVGLYASIIHVNAYHQPGVEAGKKAAAEILTVKQAVTDYLKRHPEASFTAETLASELPGSPDPELVFKILERLAANSGAGVEKISAADWTDTAYRVKP